MTHIALREAQRTVCGKLVGLPILHGEYRRYCPTCLERVMSDYTLDQLIMDFLWVRAEQ